MAKTHYIVRVNPVPRTRRAPVALVPVTKTGRRLNPQETGIVASSPTAARAAVRQLGHRPLTHKGAVVLGRHVEQRGGEVWYVEIVAVKIVATRLRNPSSSLVGRNISASYLRPGDTIQMEDLGRVHVINGPYRSGRGVMFRDQYDRNLIFRPNESVKLVARENPRGRKKNPDSLSRRSPSTVELEQKILPILDQAGALTSRTKIRETSRGGLEIKGVDPYIVARDRNLLHHLKRTAALSDYSFRLGPGWVLMLPLGWATQMYPDQYRDTQPNPRRPRSRRR
jgi:hypothetical protein